MVGTIGAPTASTALALQEILDTGIRLRACLQHVPPRRVLDATDRAEIPTLAMTMADMAQNPDANKLLVQRRDYCTPLSYANRHGNLHGMANTDSAWQFLVKTMPSHGVSQAYLRRLRSDSLKYFARKSRRLEESGRGATGDPLKHPLASPSPLGEAVSRLRTVDALEIGRYNTREFLSRRQAAARSGLIETDTRILAATIILVANVRQPGLQVFRLAYTLAVGQLCLA